jgi:hypothetical protein
LTRIFLEADTRGDSLEPEGSAEKQNFRDDVCKIVPLGQAALAVTGNQDYTRNVQSDPIPDWNALSDAKVAYAAYGDNLHAIATDWARRSAAHYALFYGVAPQRVKELSSVNKEHILVDAFILGWQRQVPILYWEKVYLDESFSSPIRTSEQVLPFRELPYTTNGVTQELYEGNSQRTGQAKALWKEASLTVPAGERGWRWLEFLIKSTRLYDESVGYDVNVIQIPIGGRAEWLQNSTCLDR